MKLHPMLALDFIHVLQSCVLVEPSDPVNENGVPLVHSASFYCRLVDASLKFKTDRFNPLHNFLIPDSTEDFDAELETENIDDLEALFYRIGNEHAFLYEFFQVRLDTFLTPCGLPGQFILEADAPPDGGPDDCLPADELRMFLDFCTLYLIDYLSRADSHCSKPKNFMKD